MARSQFGATLMAARKAKGLTQVQVAEAVGRAQTRVAAWEAGDVPPLDVLARVAEVLGVPLEELARHADEAERTLADRVRELEELCVMLASEVADVKRQLAAKESRDGQR